MKSINDYGSFYFLLSPSSWDDSYDNCFLDAAIGILAAMKEIWRNKNKA